MKLIPTILSGGAGSRLWPVSRESHPKPFIRLHDNQSLLQKAWLRGALLEETTEILTVTNREFYFKTEEEYQEISSKIDRQLANSFILEPFGRNTAPAITLAALYVQEKYGPEAILLVLAADHLINNQIDFNSAVMQACELAKQGKIITFGIQPNSAETGYGYIEANGNTVLSFVEKPSQEKAQEYLDSGKYLWNSGMFCFSAGVFLNEMQQHCPEILTHTKSCFASSSKNMAAQQTQIKLDSKTFELVPSESIDYALMEKTKKIAVVPCSLDWNDVGSWSAMSELAKTDIQGNYVEGAALLHDVNNCYIQTKSRLVGAIGIDNLVIVDTPDALLIADRNRTQDVKHLYAHLKSSGHNSHKEHLTVDRPWGSYTILEEGKNFKIKRIEVKPSASLSLQMHHHRSEHWIVISGTADIINGEEKLIIHSNQSTYIPIGSKHRLHNPGTTPLIIIEVQVGEYLGEDDIVRFDDIYGR